MASTTTKNILLSQPKAGLSDVAVTPVLTHTTVYDEGSTIIKIEVPGIDPSEIKVGCENNLLHVYCEKGEVNVSVDPTTDVSKIKADIKWGLLTVTIPAPSKPVSQLIKVNIHDVVEKKPYHKPAEKFTKSED